MRMTMKAISALLFILGTFFVLIGIAIIAMSTRTREGSYVAAMCAVALIRFGMADSGVKKSEMFEEV